MFEVRRISFFGIFSMYMICVGFMVTFVLHVIAFSTWDWVVSDGYSPFAEIGMFEVRGVSIWIYIVLNVY